MIALDNGDKIRGDASAATAVDYTLHGVVGTVVTQLADGQLAIAIGDLYTAGSAGIAVTGIVLVNTDTVARTVNLYLTPSAGTARRLIPKDMSLGIGCCLVFDGQKISVLDTSGQIQQTWAVDDTPIDGVTGRPISSNWAYDHGVAADPHTGYRLESADHTHQTTGAQAGTLDHGLALTGLTDNDHTQYLLKQMIENDPLLLDAALSADGKYSGIAEAGTSGATLVFGSLCYFITASSKWGLADATVVAKARSKLGICLVAANDTQATTILLWGKVNAAAQFPALTIGDPVHVSITAGAIQVAAPTVTTQVVRIIGYGNTADELFFCPDNTYLELV